MQVCLDGTFIDSAGMMPSFIDEVFFLVALGLELLLVCLLAHTTTGHGKSIAEVDLLAAAYISFVSCNGGASAGVQSMPLIIARLGLKLLHPVAAVVVVCACMSDALSRIMLIGMTS